MEGEGEGANMAQIIPGHLQERIETELITGSTETVQAVHNFSSWLSFLVKVVIITDLGQRQKSA